MDRRTRIRPEDLLAHVEWARDLARRLVRDDAAADDVVQETFTAALQHPPRDEGPLRPWLSRVLGNAARQRARAEGRRSLRERAVARREALPSAAELTERAEGQRLLMDALLELDETRREVVLLRYFEGLSSAEIARRQGVPAGTVRARLKRALDELRERLDGRFDGDRESWRRALAPLALATPAPTAAIGLASIVTGALLMKIVLATAVLALVGVTLFTTGVVDSPFAAPPLERGTFAPLEDPVLASAEDAPARVAVEAAAPEAREPASGAEASRLGTVRLRFVDPAGHPVPGVAAKAIPSDGRPAVVSGMDGRVAVAAWFGARPAEAQVAFSRAGFAADAVSVQGEPGCDVDVGDVRLHPGGAIVGVVVDDDGAALPDVQLWVTGREVSEAAGGGMRAVRASDLGAVRTRSDDEGRFRLEGVLAGEVRVEAESDDDLYRGRSGRVEVRAGEESRGLVVVASRIPEEDRIEGVVLDPEGRPVPWASVQGRWKSWLSSGSYGRSADREGRFRFVLSKRVALDIEIRDPEDRWTPIALEDVAPGTLDLEVRFEESAGFTVRLVRPDGAVVTAADLRVEADERQLQRVVGDAADGTFRVRLPHERFDLTVLAEGFAAETIAGIDPGAVEEVLEVELAPLPGVRGVVTADGAPVAGAALSVRELARERLTIEGLPSRLSSSDRASAESAADGSFALTLREAGRYLLRAEAEGFAATEFGPFDYDPAAGLAGVSLELDQGGAIEGRVVDGSGLRASHVVLASRGDGRVRTVRTDPEGRYRLERLVPGPWMLRVVDEEVPSGHGSWYGDGGRPVAAIEGDCEVVLGETTVHDLFVGANVARVRVTGRLDLAGDDASGWSVALNGLDPGAGDAGNARLAADGTFAVEGGAPGRYALLLTSSDDEDALRVLAELDLAAGETPFELSLSLGEVRASPATGETVEWLLWRGPAGVSALAAVPAEGEARRFPAGEVERVRLDPSRPLLADDPRTWPVVERGTLTPGGSLRLGE